MNLPETLKVAIDEEAARLGAYDLQQATQQLSQRYRDQQQRQHILDNNQRFVSNDAQRTAYVLSRMPATFGAVKYVLNELKNRCNLPFHTVLDVGAGPGTAMWAASEIFSSAREITMLEQDSSLIALGKKLASKSNHPFIQQAQWLQGDVLRQERFPENDLITVSYTMGEWEPTIASEIVKKLWSSTKKALVIIEPGTMLGFGLIRKLRQQLIDLGAHMVAPCPHTLNCPMPENDWCHFTTRIERSRLHKLAKGGSLGYEDEKFSYVVFAKSDFDLPDARILRHPLKRSGHVSLTLCTKCDGLIKKTISRRAGELYKKARNLEWGDILY